jgi:nucleoside phosphorylase
MSASPAVVAAPLEAEISPFLRRIGARRDLRSDDLRTYRGSVGDREVVAAVLGDGARRSGRGLEQLLEQVSGDRFLLIGVAGGLSPALVSGSLVQAETVVSATGDYLTLTPEGAVGGVASGTIVSSREIVGTTARKRELWRATGRVERCVVDLESWTIVRRLEREGRPLAVVRAVLDPADEDLPLDFASLSDEEGRVVRSRVLKRLLRHPSAIAGLLGLRARVRDCASKLDAVAEQWVSQR